MTQERRKAGPFLFNDALNTFYPRLYGLGLMTQIAVLSSIGEYLLKVQQVVGSIHLSEPIEQLLITPSKRKAVGILSRYPNSS